MSACKVRGRFAPSPTGLLHLGSLIAALGSFLEARRCGGEWLLRIEDVDSPRTVPGAADAILRTLEQCGLHWDGPVCYQSQRTERYQAALEWLLRAGRAYPCTCTRRQLASNPRARDGSPIYPGTCRCGVRQPDRPCAIRLRVNDAPILFQDALQGGYQQRLESEVGDFIIRRADGLFAYQLAVVVDDADQGISQVVRGSDLLDSTPRQIYLQRLLKLPTPDYAHLPVAVNSGGDKLSKQTGAPPLDERNLGSALWAALDFLGQQPPSDLVREPPTIILDWALAHWRLDRVPAIRSCHRAFFACP
ncbi:MAG: tRNA glutamyl-Q(34) synthetase GluQRS [Candidatus Competibacteraceae bacterium]|nr:tRNA glutamyl-Q(34) synthetase GluQRS [Candidatus Competibacteraceae bacterium]MBK8754433.1 tRNA glutamyl-Q(34) synthetase GluQRS [Candidatus Competibacteraceae bacterium]